MNEENRIENIKAVLQDKETLDKICRTVSSGDRIEIIPSKDGVKILRVRRNELNTQASS